MMGALNRNAPPSHLNPLSSEPGSKHASICRLERELKVNCLVRFLIIFIPMLVKLVRLRVRLLAKAVLVEFIVEDHYSSQISLVIHSDT